MNPVKPYYALTWINVKSFYPGAARRYVLMEWKALVIHPFPKFSSSSNKPASPKSPSSVNTHNGRCDWKLRVRLMSRTFRYFCLMTVRLQISPPALLVARWRSPCSLNKTCPLPVFFFFYCIWFPSCFLSFRLNYLEFPAAGERVSVAVTPNGWTREGEEEKGKGQRVQWRDFGTCWEQKQRWMKRKTKRCSRNLVPCPMSEVI